MSTKTSKFWEKVTNITGGRKAWALVLGVAILLFIFLNNAYFLAQLKYYFPVSNNAPPSHTDEVKVQIHDTSNLLEIPSLNITAPVVYVNESNEKAFQAALVDGVVHYPGTAKPGESGNVYIFGHSSDYVFTEGRYKSIFALLPNIEVGALVNISDAAGKIFVYKVTQKFVVSPKEVSVLAQDETKHILTLQTSYPVGTALQRYIVVSELQE